MALLAADYAGDGGFVRLRIMAINMLSQMVVPEEGRRLSERAARLAKQLEDEDLLQRVQRHTQNLHE